MKEFFSLEESVYYFKERLLGLSEYTYVHLDAHQEVVQNVIRTLEGVEGDVTVLPKSSLKEILDVLIMIQEEE
jgi:hypothetical protein